MVLYRISLLEITKGFGNAVKILAVPTYMLLECLDAYCCAYSVVYVACFIIFRIKFTGYILEVLGVN